MRTMQTGPILIADITGYSRYLNESELVHAEQTLSAFLELLVEQTRPPFMRNASRSPTPAPQWQW